MSATFNRNNHTVRAGWATYMKPDLAWLVRPHGFLGHVVPATPPEPANGHSPSNYARCSACGAPLKWFVLGQHRYGSIADATLRGSVTP